MATARRSSAATSRSLRGLRQRACACATRRWSSRWRPWLREQRGIAGSEHGGGRAAAIYTLIRTAKLNDVDPQTWLADVLARLPDHPGQAGSTSSTRTSEATATTGALSELKFLIRVRDSSCTESNAASPRAAGAKLRKLTLVLPPERRPEQPATPPPSCDQATSS